MPIFNVIRVHEYHLLKVKAHRNSLNAEIINKEFRKNPLTKKWLSEFNEWKNYIKIQNKRKSVLVITVNHLFDSNNIHK
jgi:hypothetical protein